MHAFVLYYCIIILKALLWIKQNRYTLFSLSRNLSWTKCRNNKNVCFQLLSIVATSGQNQSFSNDPVMLPVLYLKLCLQKLLQKTLRSALLCSNMFSRNIVYSDHRLVSNQGVFDIDRGSGFKHSCTCGIDQRTAKIPAKEMKRFTAATVVKRLQQRKIFLRTGQRQPNSYHPHPQETRVSSGNVRLYG